MKVVFATPFLVSPHPAWVSSMEAMVPAIEAAGWEHGLIVEAGNPYISAARATMLRKAMDAQADVVVFIDYDLSWRADDMVRLLSTPDPVVAGTYRFKNDGEEYMGAVFTDADDRPVVREDGCIAAKLVPAGFLKVTRGAAENFGAAYPELTYGPADHQSIDLFNHGAIEGIWWGEDYAFSKRWRERCGDIWMVPDLNLNHHGKDRMWEGNFHQYLMRQPGGSHAAE